MLFHRIAANGFLLITLYLLLDPLAAHAQKQCHWLVPIQGMQLDSLPIIPASIRIVHPADIRFRFDASKQQIYFDDSSTTLPDSIYICYELIQVALLRTYKKRSTSIIDSTGFFRPVGNHQLAGNQFPLELGSGLQTNGVLARGMSVGSQQSAQLNSTLNLQIEGQLSEDIQLRASITDRQLPYEPEGNTQQIQDFDHILVEFIHPHARLQLGDVVLENHTDYFLKFQRNVQGAQLESQYKLKRNRQAQTKAGAAIAKGRFHSAFIQPIEGVLGPYRLRGAEGERFVTILAGSEQVYLDGRRLERGFDRDYVIDYNRAEISFNPHLMITRFSRIRIDYQYTERSYTRLNAYLQQSWQSQQSQSRLTYYIERDNPNQPLLFQLSEDDKRYLASIGNDTERAFISGADTSSFQAEIVLYKKIDTLTASGLYRDVFVYTTLPTSPLYQVRFTEVGPNRGDYILENNLANGRVFRWVEPQNGIPQGNYAPVIQINLPQQRSMLQLWHQQHIGKRQILEVDAALSTQDLNLFSDIGNENKHGAAFRLHYQYLHPTTDSSRQWQSGISYEYNAPNFRPIDRFRDIEFHRDWTLPYDTSRLAQNSEHILELYSQQRSHRSLLAVNLTYRKRSQQLEGIQQRLQWQWQKQSWQFQLQAFALQAQLFADTLQKLRQSRWLRLVTQLRYNAARLQPGLLLEIDQNRMYQPSNDSVVFSAMHYQAVAAFIESGQHAQSLQWRIQHSIRQDHIPWQGSIEPFSLAHTTQASLQLQHAQQRLEKQLTYRHLRYTDSLSQESHWAIRLIWESQLLQRHLQQQLTYQHGTSRELKRTFIFVQVPTGTGTHTWRDDNGDGIAQIDEFYPAFNPDEKNYIKVFIPTDEYLPAYSSEWFYRLQWQLPQQSRWRSISGMSSWQASQRSSQANSWSRWLPWISPTQTEALLAQRRLMRHTLFWHRQHPKYGITFNYWQNQQRQLLVQGYEDRSEAAWEATPRLNWFKQQQLLFTYQYRLIRSQSDIFANRNFEYLAYRLELQNVWQFSSSWRLRPAYAYQYKQATESIQPLFWHEVGIEMQWARYPAFNLQGQLRWMSIKYENTELNSPLAYEMLESYQPGQNLNWSLQWQQRLANGLQLSFFYQGRKLPAQSIIHFGNVRMALIF